MQERGVDAHQHGLGVGRADGALREHREQTVGGDVGSAHQLAGLVDDAGAAAPCGPGQRVARRRSERPQRGQEDDTEGTAGGHAAAPQPHPPTDRLAAVQVGVQRSTLVRCRLQGVTLLDVVARRHQPVGPHDEPDPDAEQGHGQQRALQLGVLTAGPERGKEAECGDRRQREGSGGNALRPTHVRVPIKRSTPSTAARATRASAPSGSGPRCQSGAPPASSVSASERT